jgi:replicative DNA helicase
MYRLVASICRIDHNVLVRGKLSNSDALSMAKVKEKLKKAPVHFVENVNIKVEQLVLEAKKLHKAGKLDLLIIDYLQLLDCAKEFRNKNNKIEYITRTIKKLTIELQVSVLLLSQLSRPHKGHETDAPRLSDLRDSGAIEQDADIVVFIHQKVSDPRKQILVAKNRNQGPAGVSTYLDFEGQYQRFRES